MKLNEHNTTLIEGYAELLDNLSTANKRELISILNASIKRNTTEKKSAFKKAYGAFISEKSAEKIIEEILSSRRSTRKIAEF